ncbi:MAG: 4a-hydroxytetrahydrobiopterin dehydratase [Gammaproteobacteria bacterium]|nr:4a-hydroxytetrahydrobiopterin dehydratase [Gammaproteobacteria bacterium]
MSTQGLRNKHCQPCKKGDPPQDADQAAKHLPDLNTDRALVWVTYTEDYHPDLEVGDKRCRMRYSTHSVGGLSGNEFISAAWIGALLPGSV